MSLLGAFPSLPPIPSSPPCHHPAGAADGCGPGVTVPPCLHRVLMGAGEVGPSVSLCVNRGGAQRRPVPQCPGGADQLPVHGAHVPLCRGPGADAEGHGWCWSQQVSSSHPFRLLSRSPPPSGQRSGQSWVQRGVHHPGCFLLVPWLQQDPCSRGQPPTARGSETGQPRPPRHPAWPFPPGLPFPSRFRWAVSCAEQAFSVPHHGPVRSSHRSTQPSSSLSLCPSKEQSGDRADWAGPAPCCSRTQLLFPLPLLPLRGSCRAPPALAEARVYDTRSTRETRIFLMAANSQSQLGLTGGWRGCGGRCPSVFRDFPPHPDR